MYLVTNLDTVVLVKSAPFCGTGINAERLFPGTGMWCNSCIYPVKIKFTPMHGQLRISKRMRNKQQTKIVKLKERYLFIFQNHLSHLISIHCMLLSVTYRLWKFDHNTVKTWGVECFYLQLVILLSGLPSLSFWLYPSPPQPFRDLWKSLT